MADEVKRASTKGQMLPGLAGICMFLIFLTMVNVYAGLQGFYGGGRTRYAILTLCTILAAGIFGLLRLRKWGWKPAATALPPLKRPWPRPVKGPKGPRPAKGRRSQRLGRTHPTEFLQSNSRTDQKCDVFGGTRMPW